MFYAKLNYFYTPLCKVFWVLSIGLCVSMSFHERRYDSFYRSQKKIQQKTNTSSNSNISNTIKTFRYKPQVLLNASVSCRGLWNNALSKGTKKAIALSSMNATDSGVHGGLVVLEPSFTGETMATALGIPPSKSIIRRHLVAEFDALIIPAR